MIFPDPPASLKDFYRPSLLNGSSDPTPLVNFRLTVRDWKGAFRHERYANHRDPALLVDIPADGIEAGRTGHGGCLEMTFQAMWASLRAEERDLLELDVLPEGGNWTREWAGVVVKSGNSQVTWTHSNFKAVGLKKRCQEVRLVADVGEADVGAQLRAALRGIMESNQLGAAIIYDPALIRDTGVVLGAFPARGRKFSDFADYLAGQAGCVWDVGPDRKFFFRKADPEVLLLSESAQVQPTYEDTDSEALVTRVLINIGTRTNSTLIQYPVDAPEAARYGYATHEVTVDPSTVRAWRTVALDGGVRVTNTAPPSAQAVALMFDRQTLRADGTREVLAATALDATKSTALEFTLAEPAWRIEMDIQWENPPTGGSNVPLVTIKRPDDPRQLWQVPTQPQPGGSSVPYLRGWAEPEDAAFPTGTRIIVTGGRGQGFMIAELRPETPDAALLTPLGKFHLVLPHRDPATITLTGRVTPRPNLRLMRMDGTSYETTTESVSLHLKLGASGMSIIKAGQRESAEDRAKRWLDQMTLGDATMTAVRFNGGT